MDQSVLSLIILCVIIILFATRLIPLGITAVLGATAMAVTGIISYNEAYAAFGSDTVMLIFGMIVVGNAFGETGFTDVLGKGLVKIPAICKNERLFLIIIMTVVAVISGFMSNTATVAIFLPLIASVAKSSGGAITKKNTYMAVGIASIIGGNLTLAGSTPQIVAQGILTQTDGCRPLTFFELSKGAIPLILTMIIFFITVGYRLQKQVFNFEDVETSSTVENKHVKKSKVIICGLIFLWCIIGFVFNIFSIGTVAIIGACACVVTGCISFERAFSTMDWTSILVLGGSMGFSKGLEKSGALQMLSRTMIDMLGNAASPLIVFAMFLILAAIMGNIMSHTATTAVLVPVAITVAMELGSSPVLFAVAVIFGCNLAFATPVSTPPLTMTLCGGYRFSDYVIVGGALNIICVIVALITLPLLYGI